MVLNLGKFAKNLFGASEVFDQDPPREIPGWPWVKWENVIVREFGQKWLFLIVVKICKAKSLCQY